jgi:uracil-DNA glycosylase
LKDILERIDESGQEIRPRREDVLGIYGLLSPEEIKVVIIGQSPYPDDNASYIPFISKLNKKPRTLQVLCQEVKLEYGVDISNPNSMIEKWVKQGVFIINSCPTIGIRGDDPSSFNHSILWRELMENLVKYICTRKIPLLLFGKEAWYFEQCSSSEFVRKVPHPVSRDGKFIGCMIFTKTNKYLENIGKEIIEWHRS